MISVTAFKKLDLKQFVKTRGMVASKNSIYRENVVDFQTFRSEIPPVIIQTALIFPRKVY